MKCDSYHEVPHRRYDPLRMEFITAFKYECWGTKERENCTCGGDTSNCNFYPEKREKKESYHRQSKIGYYLDIAAEVAKRSTCLRRQYGAIIVKNDEIIATGYNGAPRGEDNCCDIEYCWREAHNIPHGEQYEKCVAVHAEMNAIISAARKDMIGATLYLSGWEDGQPIDAVPCEICKRLIVNAGIVNVVTRESSQTHG